jgi:hypothetical protein
MKLRQVRREKKKEYTEHNFEIQNQVNSTCW